jgi:hypothetical protein
LLAGVPPYAEMTASKLADDKAAASCRTPKLRPKQKNLPAFGVGSVLLSKHGRRLDFSSHPNGPQGMGLYCAFSTPGSENTFILRYWMTGSNIRFSRHSRVDICRLLTPFLFKNIPALTC